MRIKRAMEGGREGNGGLEDIELVISEKAGGFPIYMEERLVEILRIDKEIKIGENGGLWIIKSPNIIYKTDIIGTSIDLLLITYLMTFEYTRRVSTVCTKISKKKYKETKMGYLYKCLVMVTEREEGYYLKDYKGISG